MTSKIKGFTVTLNENIREDDFQDVINAVGLIKGVIHVKPIIVTGEDYIIKQRIKLNMIQKLLKILHEE